MKGLPVCCALFSPLHFCNARPFCLSQALDKAHFPGDFSAPSGLLIVSCLASLSIDGGWGIGWCHVLLRERRLALSDSNLMLPFKFSSRNKSLLWLTQAKEHALIGRTVGRISGSQRPRESWTSSLERRELKPGSGGEGGGT